MALPAETAQRCVATATASAAVRRLALTPNTFQMSKYTAFRCPEDLLELAKVKAKKDRRSLSNYIITLIEKDVQDMMHESEGANENELHAQKRK